MKVRVLLGLIPLAIVACGDEARSEPRADVAHGSLAVALTGSDIHGRQYRLRDAVFDVYGCPDYYQFSGSGGAGGSFGYECTSTELSSEDDLDASAIVKRLVPGYYNVSLRGGWRLEEITAAGVVPVEKSVLLSGSSQYVYVWDRGQAQAVFLFGANGDLIDFRHGDLTIAIQVEQPGDRDCYSYDTDAGVDCPVAGRGGAGGYYAGSGGFGGGF